ncbi:MAG: DUF58 domain-containing protein [Candidatus Omnitrophica bacterium]|nr:DUF58 domain-containing protein [Candidatus Omnitrophota bacterium]MBU4589804.1 DUF58 domain-containing protein [Candidatus Omnitrophota bacterium]
MFTAKSIFLVITVVVLLAIAWNTDITMVYIFFVISFVMFVLSFVHLQINIPDISVTRELNETAFEDDILNVKMEISNKRGLAASFFELIDRFPAGPPDEKDISIFVLDIKAREKKKISYVANCYKRGLWELGPVRVVSQDALGFFRMKKSLKVFSQILIYPSLFNVFAFPPLASGSVSWMGVETAKISGDSHEFFGVREYQSGDAMSRIHWPSSARHNRLIVKQFERNAVQEVTIVLDLKKGHDIGTGKKTTLEYAVKIAGSVARYLLNEGAFVQMIGYGKEAAILPFGKGESARHKILEYLARVQAGGNFSLAQTLEEASFVTPYSSTLIAIMLDNDTEAVSSLVQFKVKGIKLILIVLSTSTFGPVEESAQLDADAARRFDEGLASLEAYVYRVSKGDDLEKKFETV